MDYGTVTWQPMDIFLIQGRQLLFLYSNLPMLIFCFLNLKKQGKSGINDFFATDHNAN